MERVKRFYRKLHENGIYFAFRDAIRVILPLWWSRNTELNYQIQLSHTSQCLWRHYKRIIMQPVDSKVGEHSNIIWVCWLQGIKTAPILVQKDMKFD